MRDPQDIVNHLTREGTQEMMTCCMDNLVDEDVVEVIMAKAPTGSAFLDELRSAIDDQAERQD